MFRYSPMPLYFIRVEDQSGSLFYVGERNRLVKYIESAKVYRSNKAAKKVAKVEDRGREVNVLTLYVDIAWMNIVKVKR